MGFVIKKIASSFMIVAMLTALLSNTPLCMGARNRFHEGYVARRLATTIIVVDKTGANGSFTSIQNAVDSISLDNTNPTVIQINAGEYIEKVEVPSNKPYITFQGAGRDVTTITWDDTATSSGSTFKSATVAINSDFFIARDISFKNSAPTPQPGVEGKQAVALRISGDKASFYNCGFYGAQDTLYDDSGRHYFENCFIQGSMDFICGNGQSYYVGCELHSIATSTGSLTAQRRSSSSEKTGFSFINCKVSGTGLLYLGRAWGPYSRVVYLNTDIADIIQPEGWYDWGDSSRQNNVYYAQYKCTGLGANQSARVSWSYELTDLQASSFLTTSFIDGATWLSA